MSVVFKLEKVRKQGNENNSWILTDAISSDLKLYLLLTYCLLYHKYGSTEYLLEYLYCTCLIDIDSPPDR